MTCEVCQEQLIDLADGELDEARAAQLRQHLEECAVCREALAQMQRTRALFASAIEEEPGAEFDAPILAAARDEALRAMAGRAAAASVPAAQHRFGHAEQRVERRSREIRRARSTRWRRALLGSSVAVAAALAVVVSTRESIQARFSEVYTDRSSRPLLPAEEKMREPSAKPVAPDSEPVDRLAVLAPDRRFAAPPPAAAPAAPDARPRAKSPIAAPSLPLAAGQSTVAAGAVATPAKAAVPNEQAEVASNLEAPATAVAASPPASSAQSEGERAAQFEPGLAKSARRAADASSRGAVGGALSQPAPRAAIAAASDSAPAASVAAGPADEAVGGARDPAALERRATTAQRAGRLPAAAKDFRAAARARENGDVAQAAADFVSAIECDAARGDLDAARSSRAELAALNPPQPAALATADRLIAAAQSGQSPR